MTIRSIQKWHELARPTPDQKAFDVQLGCHFEEIREMLEALGISNNLAYMPSSDDANISASAVFSTALNSISILAESLKAGVFTTNIENRKELADSIGDQVVTGMGVAHCAAMNGSVIVERIDHSNWSKFVNGKPEFHENGKIAKPATYQPPDLSGTY